MSRMLNCYVSFVSYICNKVAHRATNWVVANHGAVIWLKETPQWLLDCIEDDLVVANNK